MTFTPEQLRQFAEAGGYKWYEDPTGADLNGFHWLHPNTVLYEDLPDFPNDLAACFEVLEHLQVPYQLNRCHPDDVAQYGQYELAIYTPFSETRNGPTKQAAIIAAVLAAKEANDRH